MRIEVLADADAVARKAAMLIATSRSLTSNTGSTGTSDAVRLASAAKRLQAADPSIPAGRVLQTNAVLLADKAAAEKKVA